MKTIHISHKLEALSFTFTYDEFTDQIRSFEIEGILNDKRYAWFNKHFPFSLAKINEWKSAKNFVVTEQKQDISFEAFYNKYGNKTGRKQAENAWKRLSKAKQALAFNYIGTYKYKLKAGTELRYPATYLNSEPWND